jgi:hypothetical protein
MPRSITDYEGNPVTDYQGKAVTDYITESRRLDWLVSKTLLLLQDPDGEKYAQARIIQAVNFACLEIAMTTELIKDEVGIQIIANQAIYNILNAIEDTSEEVTDYAGNLITDYTGNPITDYPHAHPLGYPVRIGYNGNKSPGLLPVTTMIVDSYTLGAAEYSDPQDWRLDMLSYGEIQIDPISLNAGNTLPDTTGNLQVTYVGLPYPMAIPGTDYPDPLIPGRYHEFIPFFAARLILDEGDVEDMALGDTYGQRWRAGMNEVKSDSYNLTSYSDARPM